MSRVIFMGTPNFSVPILAGLIKKNYEILAVVTQPDRPFGRKKILHASPVKELAKKHGLLILQPEKISNSLAAEKIISLQPDLIITAAFGQFLPESVLNAARFGAVNVHASLLPKYRGGSPVHSAIINGENETGVTIINMVKKMDAGDILAQKAIPITFEDNVGTMFEKLSTLGRDLLLSTLPKYLANEIKPIPQDESQVSFAPNIKAESEKIDWQKSASAIFNQIRGMYPWPVAHTTWQKARLKIQKATPIAEKTTEKGGTIIKRSKKELVVACGKNSVLQLLEIQPAGKKVLSISNFLNGIGRNLKIGDILGE